MARITHYGCARCGYVFFEDDLRGFMDDRKFSDYEKRVLSICFRNEYERRGRQAPTKPATLPDMGEIIDLYRSLEAIDKMDNALLNLDKRSKYIGYLMGIKHKDEFPYYSFCVKMVLSMPTDNIHTKMYIIYNSSIKLFDSSVAILARLF